MTSFRATYRGWPVVIRFEKFGDGERCGASHRPLYPQTRNIAGVLFKRFFSDCGIAFQLLQKPARCLTECFQSSLSAGWASGLVVVVDGHDHGERKIGNVRKGVGEIQNV